MWRWIVTASIMVLLTSGDAKADLGSDLAGCAAITKSAERLACYDKLAEGVAPNARSSNPSIEGSGKWKVSTEISPVDDSTNVYLYLDAEDVIQGKFGDEVRPSLYVRCKENETDLYISWERYLGLDTTDVLIRLDKGEARETSWYVSTDSDASFHPKPIALIKETLTHDLLLARTTPYSESPVTTTFDIRGLSAVVGKVQEACHW